MKNLDKNSPEASIILSDREMKEISGGISGANDGCPQTGDFAQCHAASYCTKNGEVGFCGYILGEGGGCRCTVRELA